MTISVNAEPALEAETSRFAKWAIALFFVTLFIPGSFYIGVRMTPYRLLLLVLAIPMALRFYKDPTMRVTPVDALMFLFIFWRSLALMVNHQMAELLNAASSFVELFFGYLFGRVFVRSAADYRFFFKCFLFTLLAFLPFALVELTTRKRLLRDIAGILLIQPPQESIGGAHVRFGLLRVQASFDHAIIYGTFCAVGFANAFYIFRDMFPRNVIYSGFTAFMAFLAISSTSILTIFLQAGLIAYEILFRPIKGKWIFMAVSAVVIWFSFELIAGKTVPEYVATELVLNQTGAEGRMDQVTFGMKEVRANPIFGIGKDPPALPFWRGDILDNFWLQMAVQFGIPGLVLVACAFALHFLKASFAPIFDERDAQYRRGYLIALFAAILILAALSPWGIGLVFLMVYVGAGGWFYDRPRPGPSRARARPALAPRTRAPLGARAPAAAARRATATRTAGPRRPGP